MMNKNAAIAIGVVLCLVLAGLVYVVPAMYPDNSMTVTFYDAEGDIVQSTSTKLSLWPWAFMDAAGLEVTKVEVTVDYDTAFTGAGSPTGLFVDCTLTRTVCLNTQTQGIVNGPLEETQTLDLSSGTFTFTYWLSVLISPVDASGKTNGWGIKFKAELAGSAFLDGVPVTATPWSDSITATVDWDEEALTMSFVDAYVGPMLTP